MTPETHNSEIKKVESVAGSAFKVALGGMFGLILRLFSQVIIASIFGAGSEVDAYLTALTVPTYLEAVLIGGLVFVFIPAFLHEKKLGRRDNAWSFAGTVLWLTLIILTIVAFCGSIASRGIIELSAPGLRPEKAVLAAKMLAILMFASPLTGAASLTEGIQNSRDRFFWPAVAPAIGAMGNIMIILLLYRTVGPLTLAWGYLVSAAMRFFVTLIPVLKHGWTGLMPFSNIRMREMARLITPFIFLGVITRSQILFERYYASGLSDGDLSYIGYAYKISNILVILIAEGIAVAILPAMARAYVEDEEVGLVLETENGLRLSLSVALPSLAILSAVAVPLVSVLFERGAFQHNATLSVSRVVPIILIGDVLFRMMNNVIVRSFYVTKDTYTSPIVNTITSGIYILLAKSLVETKGYVGLALAQPLCMGLNVIILFPLLWRKLKHLNIGILFKSSLFYGVLSFMAYIVAWSAYYILDFLPSFIRLITALSFAGILYIGTLLQVDRDIAQSIFEMIGIQRFILIVRARFRHQAEVKRT